MSRWLTLLLLLALAAPAAANEPAADRRQRARALWQEGVARYDLGRFDQAIDLFERAYEIHPYPEILFNLGQAHRQKKSYERAIFYLRAYLRNKPEAGNRPEVEELIAEMEQLLAAQQQAAEKPPDGVEGPPHTKEEPPPPVEAPPAASPVETPLTHVGRGPVRDDRRWYHEPWGWTFGVTGAGLLAGGIYFQLGAWDHHRRAKEALDPFDAERLQDGATRRQWFAIGVGAAGAAALGAGIYLFVRPGNAGPPRNERAGVWIVPTFTGMALEGRF